MILIVFLLILSGCVTTQEVKEAEVQQLRERISYLERRLKEKEEENIALKKALERKEEKIILKMPDASQIQTALKNAGFYDGKIDGLIGPETREAIRKFQEKNGLNPDGVVGSRTWEKLGKYLGQ